MFSGSVYYAYTLASWYVKDSMPELPEVESVRRVMERVLVGQTIAHVEIADDPIVLSKVPSSVVEQRLAGARVQAVGRKGKLWWIALEEEPWLYGHLGMSGWIRQTGIEREKRLVSHGKAKLDDDEGNPRFLKMRLTTEAGGQVVLTDGRRLARLWLGEHSDREPKVLALGPDAWTAPLSVSKLAAIFQRRSAPIKALLLDQTLFAGVGNWVADEVLYHARISPNRPASSLTMHEIDELANCLQSVLTRAVEVDAESSAFPSDWLFHVRWGGSKGSSEIGGRTIRRDTVGGRTTAWVPDLQK